MKFIWEMTEMEWKNYMRVANDENYCKEAKDIYFGSMICGDYCVDFMHTLDESDYYAFPYVYVLGIDDGYGEHNGIPYSLTDIDFIVPLNCETFEGFKYLCEYRLLEEVKEIHGESLMEKETRWN